MSDPVAEPVVAEPVATPSVCSNNKCEERLDKLINILKSSYKQYEVDDNVWRWNMDLIRVREEICDL